MAKRRNLADSDTYRAIAKGREAVHESRRLVLDSAIATRLKPAGDARLSAVLGRPDFSVSTAAVLTRELQREAEQ